MRFFDSGARSIIACHTIVPLCLVHRPFEILGNGIGEKCTSKTIVPTLPLEPQA